MRALGYFVVFVGCALVTFSSNADSEDISSIVEVHNGSISLPDWAAYKTFLVNVQGHGTKEGGHSDIYLGRIFGIDPESLEGAAKIGTYRELFNQDSIEIERDMDLVSDQLFCPSNWQEMSFDEVIDGMEERRVIRETMYKSHLESSLELIGDEDRSALLDYLEDIKKRTSFVRHDNRRYYEKRPDALSKFHRSVCDPESIQVSSSRASH